MDYIPDTPRCFRSHMGLWAIREPWFEHAVSAALANLLPLQAVAAPSVPPDTDLAEVTDDGILVLPIHGQITKGFSKFGGTSTVASRRLLRIGLKDPAIRAGLIHAYSPGGHVDGVHELSEDVRRFAEKKPLHAHIEDLGASAAVWAIAHAQRLTINLPGETGSIGAFAILHDISGAMEREGVRVIRVASGPMKGLGAPGTPITEEIIAEVQKSVDRVHGLFTRAVSQGRGLSLGAVQALADGRTFGAREAKRNGLVDDVSTFDDALGVLRRELRTARTAPQGAALAARHAQRAALLDCQYPSEDLAAFALKDTDNGN